MALTADELRDPGFSMTHVHPSGYRLADVDRFLRRAADTLDGAQEVEGGPVTADEARNVFFSPAPRGYETGQVKALIDRLVEELESREQSL